MRHYMKPITDSVIINFKYLVEENEKAMLFQLAANDRQLWVPRAVIKNWNWELEISDDGCHFITGGALEVTRSFAVCEGLAP